MCFKEKQIVTLWLIQVINLRKHQQASIAHFIDLIIPEGTQYQGGTVRDAILHAVFHMVTYALA